MKKILLSEKLILYFVLLGLGAIVIISTVSFYSTKSALMNRTFDQLTSLRIVKKNQVEQFFNDRSRDLYILASAGETKAMASIIEKGGRADRRIGGRRADEEQTKSGRADRRTGEQGDGMRELVLRFLTEFGLFSTHFDGFYLFSDPGMSVGQTFIDSVFSGMKPLPNMLKNVVHQVDSRPRGMAIMDEVFDSAMKKPRMFMATRIGDGNIMDEKDGCTLVLEISLDAIDTIMLNNNPLSGLGFSGETYLVGSDYRMRSTSRFQPGSILKTLVKTLPATEAIAGKKGNTIVNDYRNIPVLSSYGDITVPGLNWAILAEIDVQEAMIPIYETLTRIMLLSILILVFFFACVFVISRHITRPLIRLKDATINLGEGRFDIELPVTTGDEIGLLTESFNIMTRQIKEKTNELQEERFGRMRSVIDGEEMERQRLSRELHDGIGQSLIAIKLRLENLLYQDGKEIRNSIQELKKYFDQIIDEVRRISNNLMPSVLEVFSIPIAFRNLFSETEEHGGPRIHFEAKGNFDDLDKKIKTYIYRLTQEALNNIVKHAEAREVWVNLTRSMDHLILVIRDDGKGFSPEIAGKEGGNGIHNMRERASLLQGQIEIRSAPSKGTTITLNVPIIITYVKNQDFPRG